MVGRLSDRSFTYRKHGGTTSDAAHAQVHPQPSLGPKADGCVSVPRTQQSLRVFRDGCRIWIGRRESNNSDSDILHPNRANISKDELREKLAEMYKAGKEQVNVFGLRTQFGGGKTTGFALVYDSPEALKKFEPHYRLVRIGAASKIEKASRQQRTFTILLYETSWNVSDDTDMVVYRQATQEQTEDTPWNSKGQGPKEEEGIDDWPQCMWRTVAIGVFAGIWGSAVCLYPSTSVLCHIAVWDMKGKKFGHDGMKLDRPFGL